jgi:molybdate transport system regulatory protein
MRKPTSNRPPAARVAAGSSGSKRADHARIVAVPEAAGCLDPVQLERLEQAYRIWAGDSPRQDVRRSRNRILLIFLIIRFTGAKLSEVLALDPTRDIDFKTRRIRLGRSETGGGRPIRQIQIPEALAAELQKTVSDPSFQQAFDNRFRVDPGHVRRKFYERAADCGYPQSAGAPEVIRKSRAVELMQHNVPLPVVQRILGHSNPSLTAAYVAFSDEDIQKVAEFFAEKESQRKTSARNAFFGKIQAVRKDAVQSRVDLLTVGGDRLTTVITNESLERLGLKTGSMVTAEVKAPWVMLHKQEEEPAVSAENRFRGTVSRVIRGKVSTEFTVTIADGTELCAVMATESGRRLGLKTKDAVWAVFNCFAVVLRVD